MSRAKTAEEIALRLKAVYHDFDHHNLRDDPLGELLFILCSVRTHAAGYSVTFNELRRVFPTIDSLAGATITELSKPLHSGGRAAVKAQAIRSACDGIISEFGSLSLEQLHRMSDSECETFLTSLPYVGKKVARCVMMYSLDREVFPVDLHCWRISQRLGWVRPTRPDGTCSQRDMDRLQAKIPAKLRFSLHVNMVSHGRVICTSSAPKCWDCAVNDLCPKIGVRLEPPKHPYPEGVREST